MCASILSQSEKVTNLSANKHYYYYYYYYSSSSYKWLLAYSQRARMACRKPFSNAALFQWLVAMQADSPSMLNLTNLFYSLSSEPCTTQMSHLFTAVAPRPSPLNPHPLQPHSSAGPQTISVPN